MFKKIILGVIRHTLTTSGGSGVTAGLLSGDELTTLVSSVVTVVGILWSMYDKYSDLKKEKKEPTYND